MGVVFSSIPSGSNGTALTSIVPETGTGFSVVAGGEAGYSTAEVQSGYLYLVPNSSFAKDVIVCNTAAPVGNRQKISAKMKFGADAANSFHGLVVNCTSFGSRYYIEWNQYAGPGIVLFRVAGATTGLAGYNVTPSNNTEYDVSLENDGTGNLTVKLNGSTIITFDDSANNLTGGSAGLKTEQFGTSVPLLTYRNIVVDDGTAAPAAGFLTWFSQSVMEG